MRNPSDKQNQPVSGGAISRRECLKLAGVAGAAAMAALIASRAVWRFVDAWDAPEVQWPETDFPDLSLGTWLPSWMFDEVDDSADMNDDQYFDPKNAGHE